MTTPTHSSASSSPAAVQNSTANFVVAGRVAGLTRNNPNPGTNRVTQLHQLASPAGALQLTVVANQLGTDQVRVALTVNTAGVQSVSATFSASSVTDANARPGAFNTNGRDPMLYASTTVGNTGLSFDVYPGHVRTSSADKQLDFTFVIVGDVQINGANDRGGSGPGGPGTPPGQGASQGTSVWVEHPAHLAALVPGPTVEAVATVVAAGSAQVELVDGPAGAVHAHCDRVSPDPASGRPRTRVVLGGLGRLDPRASVESVDALGETIAATSLEAPAELALGSVEYNAVTVVHGRGLAGEDLGFRLRARGELLAPRRPQA